MALANRCCEDSIAVSGASRKRAAYAALFGPQTSGGLLLGVDAAEAEAVVNKLNTAGYDKASFVGRVVPRLADAAVEIRGA